MCSGFCLRILFAFFPAYVSCLGIYEGKVPNVQRVSAHTFPEIGPEVKQDGNWIDSTYSSVHLPHTQDTQRRYVGYQKERLIKGSHLNDCPTQAESDNQDNVINKPSTSVANNHLLGFGQHSSLLPITATDIFKNDQPVSQQAYTSSQGGSPFGTPKLLGSKPFKSSSDESSHELPKFSTAESSKIFAVQAPEHAYGHLEFKPQLTKNMLARGPNQRQSTSTSSQILHQHRFSQGSQSTRNVQLASSTYSPFLGGTPMRSSTSSRKPSHDGLKHTEAKPSIVSSGPIFVLQGSESTQGLWSYSKHPNFVKPLGVLSNVDSNQNVVSQSSETSRVTLNIDSQPSKSWNEPRYYSMKGGQHNASLKPRKLSGSDCRDRVGKYSSASSDKILNAPKSAEGNKLLHSQDVWDTRKFQKTYNARDPPQSRFPVYSVSGSQPNRIFGAQRNVPKSSIASSGEIRIMQVPATVQSRTRSNKPQVTSKPHPSFPEYGVKFASSETAHQYQLFKTNQKPRNVQPAPGTYASPPQSGYQAFSFKGLPYKPRSVPSKSLSESGSGAIKQSVGDSEMKAVRVRLNKWPKSSFFGNLKDQWASGDNVGSSLSNSGALQSFLPPGYLGQKQGQNVQTHARSSVPQYHGSNEVQSESTVTHEMTTSPHEFGKDVIRRLSPTFSSSYRPAPQNQAQRVDSSALCEVTQNHPSGLGQQGPVPFQGVKHFL